jgi:hypothetical protein
VKLLEPAFQVGLLLLGGLPPGVEVRAEVGVGLTGLEDLVGDLEQGVRMAWRTMVSGSALCPAWLSPSVTTPSA